MTDHTPVEIERLRLNLIRLSLDFMKDIGDDSLPYFMIIEKRKIAQILEATDQELLNMNIIRGNTGTELSFRENSAEAELEALQVSLRTECRAKHDALENRRLMGELLLARTQMDQILRSVIGSHHE